LDFFEETADYADGMDEYPLREESSVRRPAFRASRPCRGLPGRSIFAPPDLGSVLLL